MSERAAIVAGRRRRTPAAGGSAWRVRAIAIPVALAVAVAAGVPARAATPAAGAKPRPAAAKRRPTTDEILRLLAEQQAGNERREALIAEQQEQLRAQAELIEAQRARLADLAQEVEAMRCRLDEVEHGAPLASQAYDDRLRRIEEAAEKEPELPPTVVSAGDFPGSIRIPGTDAAIKLGGRIRTAAVFTLDPLGSTDRFLTNSIPVGGEASAGDARRAAFTANTSRFNFEMRTPTGVGQTRAFLEGDFYGSGSGDERTGFRLRHAYAQFKGIVAGQTWSTFSDPAANHQDLDFEGINGENVIRQPQIRYTWSPAGDGGSVAFAAETPRVSLTGGQGVNLVPDLVVRGIRRLGEAGHLQGTVVLRQIRGEPNEAPGETSAAFAWGASLSGTVPFRYHDLEDRLVFQLNGGRGIGRYINDLQSLGGQDAVFDPATGELTALAALGWYVDYEHHWKSWGPARQFRLRSSLIWSFVTVDNLLSQPADAYHKTNRLSVNLVFSPTPRIDVGAEYIFGQRENKDGQEGSASQVQFVGLFRF
jgi:hypothetical protein